jgi:hypothetical protein
MKTQPAPTQSGSSTVFRLPDGSRSAQSPWVWRAFFFMSLIALGLSLSLVLGGYGFFAACWAIIAVGWFGISMWLWRRNVLYERMPVVAPAQRPKPRR